MGFRCSEAGCSAHVHAATYDGPVRCENGHTFRLTTDRAWRFLERATRGVKA